MVKTEEMLINGEEIAMPWVKISSIIYMLTLQAGKRYYTKIHVYYAHKL